MHALSKPAVALLKNPLVFALHTLRSFQRNQGLLLAGAIAYYALLSIVPLLILVVIALSHLVDQGELLDTLRRYMEWLVPSQSEAFIGDLAGFLENRIAIGSVLLVTLLFFSSLGFSVLEKAMAVIFRRRLAISKRHFLVSAFLPYVFVLFLGAALLGVTLASIGLQAVAQESVLLFGRAWSLRGLSGVLLYLLGLAAEILILTAIYWIIPIGRIPLRHAVLGAVAATGLWEVIRHALIWYFVAFSKASVVYGSLSTAVVALFSMEIAATLLLLGAQVIAEYERIGRAKSAPAA